MDVAIAGAHGKIARLLTPLLVARGIGVRGIVRNPDHVADVAADGATPVVCDLEAAGPAELDAALADVGAVVFAAGAGPGSGAARKGSMDRDGAVKLADAAVRLGIGRYVMISAIGADRAPDDDEVFSVYLRAKAAADEAVRGSGLDHVIVRPGGLTDGAPTGRVRLGPDLGRGTIARADVAAVLAEVLAADWSGGRTVDLVAGDVPIADAVRLVL